MWKTAALLLLFTNSLAAQPLPQLLRDYRHGEALRRIEARLAHCPPAERAQLQLWQVECLLELDRALYLMARLEVSAGRLERACELLEKSRQLRIRKDERESEVSAARAQITVLATLAPVEDEPARRFFTSFYSQLIAGYPPPEALQRAKLERSQADPDHNGAAFVLLGGCP